jgi:hypothetical protein
MTNAIEPSMTKLTTKPAPTFTATKTAITRVDERGNITVWTLLTAPTRVPRMSTGFLFECQAICTYNGKHERKGTFRLDPELVLAWQMA